jgi:hypothetical protein
LRFPRTANRYLPRSKAFDGGVKEIENHVVIHRERADPAQPRRSLSALWSAPAPFPSLGSQRAAGLCLRFFLWLQCAEIAPKE